MPLNFPKLDTCLQQVQAALKKLQSETGVQLSKQGAELTKFAQEKLLEVVLDLTKEK